MQSRFLDLLDNNKLRVNQTRSNFETAEDLSDEELILILSDRMNLALHASISTIQQNA